MIMSKEVSDQGGNVWIKPLLWKYTKNQRIYVNIIDLEKAFDRVNIEVLWKVLCIYDVGCQLLKDIKRVFVDKLTFVRVKEVSELLKIGSVVNQECITSL